MDNLEEKIDAAYNKRGNEYLFINKNNSYLPYAEGFKDGYNLAMQELKKETATGRYETTQEKGAPEDKNKLCIFYDMDGYYIDTYNNLSSSEQKNIKQWCYLPLITDGLL